MTSKQEQALAALMVYPTRKAAAAAAGITERTLRGYFKNEEFRARYREQYAEVIEDAARQSQQSLQRALAVFSEVMDDPEERAAVRLQAAHLAADYAMRLTEQADVMNELDKLRKVVCPDESGD